MKLVAVTQRVTVVEQYNERRDCLDQQWASFLRECQIIPIVLPNCIFATIELLKRIPVDGILFTGGNDLVDYGGDAPERDETEFMLLQYAIEHSLPLLGVCRGMQVTQHFFGVPLCKVEGHITKEQTIKVNGNAYQTNSYHSWGALDTIADLPVWAIAADGVVKGIKHRTLPILGVMWHPERNTPFHSYDINLFRSFFQS